MRQVTEEIQQLERQIALALAHCEVHRDDSLKPEMVCTRCHCLARATASDRHAYRAQQAAQVMVNHFGLLRNKRVCLAYLYERLARIKRVAWELGYVPEKMKPNLTIPESDFFNAYTKLMRSYSKHFDSAHFTLDLTDDLHQPPSDLFIEVRVLKEVGQVFTEDGPISLHKGTQHTMRRVDAEPYIRQGKLQQHE